MSDLTIDEIDAAENGIKRVRVILQGIGRELYEMREGKPLREQYGFSGYYRQNYAGEHYDKQEGPNWGVGTPILALSYYWSWACEEINITLPMGWLEQDWRALEADRLTAERAAHAAAEAEADRQAEVQREQADRDAYEHLKAKFESSPANGEGQ